MKTKFLIAPFWRTIGFVIAALSLAILLSVLLSTFQNPEMANRDLLSSFQNPELPNRDLLIYILSFLFILGMVLSIWAKFRREDEYTRHLRFSSSLQAIVASALYFLITYSTVYGLQYWAISIANPIIPVLFYFLIFWGKYLFQIWRKASSL